MNLKRIILTVSVVTGLIVCVQLTSGCANVTTEEQDDGITIGEGQVEDSPKENGEEPANGQNGQGRVTVNDSFRVPGEFTEAEKKEERKRQAEIEKIFKESQDKAKEWAEEDEKWVSKKLAASKAKEAEGNLKEAAEILREIIKKIPEHEAAARRLIEITAKSKREKETKKTPEERLKELMDFARMWRDKKKYAHAYRIYIEAGKLLDSVQDKTARIILKGQIEQNLKMLENLVSAEDREKIRKGSSSSDSQPEKPGKTEDRKPGKKK